MTDPNDMRNPADDADTDGSTMRDMSGQAAGSDAPAGLMGNADEVRDLDPLEAQKERYLRLAAEYDNYRKRTAKESAQASVRGQAELLRGILGALDDLDRFAHVDPATTDASAVVQGVAMVEKNIFKALLGVGVEVINPVELPFDPNLHEAVSTVAAESPDEDHMVAQVYQRGYLLKGQLLRPARVVVKQYQ